MTVASPLPLTAAGPSSAELRRAAWTLILGIALGTPASLGAGALGGLHDGLHEGWLRSLAIPLVLIDVLLHTLPIKTLRAALVDRVGTDRLDSPLRAYVATVVVAEVGAALLGMLLPPKVSTFVLEGSIALPYSVVLIWLGVRILKEPTTLFGLRPWWGWLSVSAGATSATVVLFCLAIPLSIGSVICQVVFLFLAANASSVRTAAVRAAER